MTAEPQKFDQFGQDWWNPAGKLFSLHKINPLRSSYFKEKSGSLKGKTVLDAGCGGGLLSEEFAKQGAIVTGIDLSSAAIEAAKNHAKESALAIDYRLGSPSSFLKDNPEKLFDIIVCAEVLEHVDDLKGFLKDVLKMLKTGGLFFFATINKTIKARLFAVFAAENILKMLPKGTHDPERFIRPSELAGHLRENGVELKDITGMSCDPLKMEFKLSDNPSINYLGYGVKAG